MHDIVIRGGTIVDGTGKAAFTGDVAIAGGRIAAVGGKQGPARRDIDADGLLVTPGWVDVHTHYDGQAMWDPLLAPSCWHGVTTVMFGNCGVGFAPVKKAAPRRADGSDGRRRGNSQSGAGRRPDLGMGNFPAIHGRAGAPAARHRHRAQAAHLPTARLCHGRSRGAPRTGDARRHRRDAPAHRSRRCEPAPSASPPRAPIRTRRRTASWWPRATPTIMNCSASARRWASPAAAPSA